MEENLKVNVALLTKTTASSGFCSLKRSVTPLFFGHIAFFDKFVQIVKKWTKKNQCWKFIFFPFSPPTRSNSAHFEAVRVWKCNYLRLVLPQETSKVEYVCLIDLPK